jgi:hypothetical protein
MKAGRLWASVLTVRTQRQIAEHNSPTRVPRIGVDNMPNTMGCASGLATEVRKMKTNNGEEAAFLVMRCEISRR